jgi:AraC family transcriptional regulator
MDDTRLARLTSHPPVDPIKAVPTYAAASGAWKRWGGLTVWLQRLPPVDLYLPPMTKHAVLLWRNSGLWLLQVRGGRRHEGEWQANEVAIVRAGQPSGWRAQGTVEVLHLDLEPGFLDQVALEACEMDPDRLEIVDVFQTRDPVIEHIGLALLAEIESGGFGGKLYAESLANVLAIHLLRLYCAQQMLPRPYKGGLSRQKLRRVLEHMHDRIEDQVPLSELAALAGMSPHHFIRAFRQSTGLTPHQYFIRCRIERAKILLKEATLSILDVSVQVGFHTQSHFAMHFRRLTGVTPKAYRDAL